MQYINQRKDEFYRVCDFRMCAYEDIPEGVLFVLYVISYWKKRHGDVDRNLVATLLIGLLNFFILDGKTGRSNISDETKIELTDKLKTLRLADPYEMGIGDLIEDITEEECLAARTALSRFSKVDKYTFDRKIVHAFSEFQAVLYYMVTLNSILFFPFPRVDVDMVFSGSFCFSVKKNLFADEIPNHHWDSNLSVVLPALFHHNRRVAVLFVLLYNFVARVTGMDELQIHV